MTYDTLISWLSSYVAFEEKLEGEHYKRRELIDEDIDTARSIMEDKAPVKRKAGVMKGFEGFVSNFLEPRLEEQRSDLNETKVTELEEAFDTRDPFGLRDVDVSGYERETISVKAQRTRSLRIELREERIIREQEIFEEAEAVLPSEREEALRIAEEEGRIESKEEHTAFMKALGTTEE